MNVVDQNRIINKGIQMELIVSQVTVTINKLQVAELAMEALKSGDNSSLKRVIAIGLEGKLPELEETFPLISVSGVTEEGNILVTLKKRPIKKEQIEDDETEIEDDETEIDPLSN